VRRSKATGVPKHRRFGVIMAGGAGTRFWPWSRQGRPKQLLALAGDRTMLADTAARLRGLVPDGNILVVTSSELGAEVSRQLSWLPPSSILCEPEGRNTAACVGWAALEVLAREPDGVMAALPADHLVTPAARFSRDLERAFAAADGGRKLVTFGIPPAAPATGYGYIKVGSHRGRGGLRGVEAFVEKPSLQRAKRFVRDGRYFWNSGIFVWRADVILDKIALHLPELARGLASLDAGRRKGRVPASVLGRIYPRLQKISIDHGVMEHADDVAMMRASFAWSDIGSWEALGDLWEPDAAGNASCDQLIAIDAAHNVVASRGKLVALVGVEGLVVADSGDALLVCRRDCSQEVRKVTEALARKGLKKYL